MLMQPDKQTAVYLALADYLEALMPDQFDMRQWCSCIAGHVVKQSNEPYTDYEGKAQEILGLNPTQAKKLFCPKEPGTKNTVANKSTKDAARALRHLAVTGEVVWA